MEQKTAQQVQQQKFLIDFGAVNLQSLVLTNDLTLFEDAKAQNNIGVLFEPAVLDEGNIYETIPFYLIGIRKDK